MKQVNVLGTKYSVKYKHQQDDVKLTDLDGYCDNSTKEIVICLVEPNEKNVKDMQVHYQHILTHELVHAFLYESGLASASEWANNETIVDWIALQLDKIYNAVHK